MGVNVYTRKDNGDLKLVAETDAAVEDAALAVDEVLDELPRTNTDGLVAVDAEQILDVTVESDEPVQPRRPISVNGGSPTRKRRGRPRKAAQVDEDEDQEETPKRRGRPPGSKNKQRGPGRPKGSGKKRGPGRPPGSGTKKRGPGRPPGSKNKTAAKRGPGRPPGSKNKAKTSTKKSVKVSRSPFKRNDGSDE